VGLTLVLKVCLAKLPCHYIISTEIVDAMETGTELNVLDE
jgi:hypothetical protein